MIKRTSRRYWLLQLGLLLVIFIALLAVWLLGFSPALIRTGLSYRELYAARQQWASQDITHYRVLVKLHIGPHNAYECLYDFEVQDGQVTTVFDDTCTASDGHPAAIRATYFTKNYTVAGRFATIDELLQRDGKAPVCSMFIYAPDGSIVPGQGCYCRAVPRPPTVEYDSMRGYPVRIGPATFDYVPDPFQSDFWQHLWIQRRIPLCKPMMVLHGVAPTMQIIPMNAANEADVRADAWSDWRARHVPTSTATPTPLPPGRQSPE
jgi:hypothetical protein